MAEANKLFIELVKMALKKSKKQPKTPEGQESHAKNAIDLAVVWMVKYWPERILCSRYPYFKGEFLHKVTSSFYKIKDKNMRCRSLGKYPPISDTEESDVEVRKYSRRHLFLNRNNNL